MSSHLINSCFGPSALASAEGKDVADAQVVISSKKRVDRREIGLEIDIDDLHHSPERIRGG
jgi:hypothetical protein